MAPSNGDSSPHQTRRWSCTPGKAPLQWHLDNAEATITPSPAEAGDICKSEGAKGGETAAQVKSGTRK